MLPRRVGGDIKVVPTCSLMLVVGFDSDILHSFTAVWCKGSMSGS